MRKFSIISMAITLLTALFMFSNIAQAKEMSDRMYRPCGMVVKACLKAGYAKRDGGKGFWFECMKPVLLGEKVRGVNIDSKDATACREFKIKKMKEELKEFEMKR